MAGLLDVVRAGVAIADKVSKPLQGPVVYQRCTGESAYGARTYAAPVTLRAIIEQRQRKIVNSTGALVLIRATVTFVDAPALAAATGGGPITARDKLTLPDGSASSIVDTGGLTDAATGAPMVTEVYLG